MSEANIQIGEALGSRLRIVEDELPGDGGASILVRVVHALDPAVGPCGLDRLRLLDRVLPQSDAVVVPFRGHGRHPAAVGGRQLVQLGLGGVLGVGQRIEVDEDRADDPPPGLAGGDFGVVARAIVAGGPVVEDDCLIGRDPGAVMWSIRSSFSGPPPMYSLDGLMK